MIRIVVKVGTGTKRLSPISDALIPDDVTAYIRAKQELAKSTYFSIKRTLVMPHDPAGEHGVITEDFAYQPLSIYGRHVITNRAVSLTMDGAVDTIIVEQYRIMET